MSKRSRDEPSEDAGTGKEDISLSVDATNKLRDKLGLKPLVEGADDKQKSADAQLTAERNAEAQAATAAKIAAAKEKRENKRASKKKHKSIAEEAEDEDMSAANWVKRVKKKAPKQSAAEKQAKMFDATDEAEQEAAYTEKDLKGLQMNHAADDFQEGRDVILTLKDERLLDGDSIREGGDELENIALMEQRAANKNQKLREYKAGSAYSGLDDDQWNADGSINHNAKAKVLSKYDSVIDEERGVKQSGPTTVLGEEATVKRETETKEEVIRGKIKENLQTSFKEIEEKYTQAEMASFNKPKKMRKKKKGEGKRKKTDDINWDAEEAKAIGEDHGSRVGVNRSKELSRKAKIEDAEGKLKYQSALAKAMDKTHEAADLNNSKHRVMEEFDEEEEDDLGAALAKARQLRQRIQHDNAEALSKTVKQEKDDEAAAKMEEDSEDEDEAAIVLDPTKEFCKAIEVQDAEESDDEPMAHDNDEPIKADEDENEGSEMEEDDEEDEGKRKWSDDNLVSNGVGAALDFMRSRGSLKDTDESITGRFNDKTFESLYEANSEVDRDTQKKLASFTLEYRDKFGRKMSQKEAFRQLSYGFHGKGPGKAKIEARQRKYAEEQRLRKQGQNGAIDAPITLQALKVQQKGTRQAHMVIGGGSGGMRKD